MKKAEIIICTEEGYLESLSKCLVTSIREFGGKYKDIPIISYKPRKDFKISGDTKKFFEQNNVELVDLELNKEFCNYPLANKPIVCAHHESGTSADILIFLDSDVFFINEPCEFFEFEDADVILRPSDYWNIGTNNKGDKNNSYWSSLYELLDVKVQRYTTSTVTNHTILEYYNGGHIVTLSKNLLFQQWYKNFTRVMEKCLKPRDPFFIEQSVFSATVSQMGLKVKHFGRGYNYPLSHVTEIVNPDYHVNDVDQLVSLHYHSLFNTPVPYNSITNKIFQSEKGKRINEILIKYGVKKEFSRFSTLKFLFLEKLKSKLKLFKKKLLK